QDRHEPPADVPMGDFLEGMAALRREGVLTIDDLIADGRLYQPQRQAVHKICAVILAGVEVNGELYGALSLGHVGETRHWTVEETAFARSVADLIALLMLDRRHAEVLAALDLAGDGIVVEREDGRTVYANEAALALASPGSDRSAIARPGGTAQIA